MEWMNFAAKKSLTPSIKHAISLARLLLVLRKPSTRDGGGVRSGCERSGTFQHFHMPPTAGHVQLAVVTTREAHTTALDRSAHLRTKERTRHRGLKGLHVRRIFLR